MFNRLLIAPHPVFMENSQPWSEIIMRSSLTTGESTATSEKTFYGSWNRLVGWNSPSISTGD